MLLGGLLTLGLAISGCGSGALNRTARPSSELRSAVAHLPLSFEPNRGQSDPRVRFLARGAGYGLFFTSDGAVLALSRPAKGRVPTASAREASLSMRFLSARADAPIRGLDTLPGTVNSFIGNKSASWHTGIPTFSRIRYEDPWPGVSVDFYGTGSRLEYAFRVAPGADPSRIGLAFSGERRLRLDRSGALVLAQGPLHQFEPLGDLALVPQAAVLLLEQDHVAGARDVRRAARIVQEHESE